MKKILPIVIIGMLIFCGFGAAVTNEEGTDVNYNERTSNYSNSDELDQYQTLTVGANAVGAFASTLNISWIQEFTPTKPFLTRVELYISNPDLDATLPYVVTIRDNLTGGDLTKVSVSPDEIGHNLSWVEFDFKDIAVNIGQIYYIYSYTSQVENNTYGWGWYLNSTYDAYPNGTSYWRLNPDDPFEDTTGDCAFKTYGRENTELAIEFVKSGFGGLSVVVKNIGEYEAVDVVWNLNITGGIFGLINTSLDGDADVLPAGDELEISLPLLIGLGPLKIVATADAANADKVTETWDGFILFVFIL